MTTRPRRFYKPSIWRKVVSSVTGAEYCPICGWEVKPVCDKDDLWQMGCGNLRCYAFMNIYSDVCDTKEEAIQTYHEQMRLFELYNLLTCRCNSCGGDIKSITKIRGSEVTYQFACVCCDHEVSASTELECISKWNVMNRWDKDEKFGKRLGFVNSKKYMELLNELKQLMSEGVR